MKAWPAFQRSGRRLPYAPPVALLSTQMLKSVRIPHPNLPSSSVCPRQSHCCHLDTALSLRCPSLAHILAIRRPLCECNLSQPTWLTCRPFWVCQPTLHLEPLQDKQAKRYIRGPLRGTLQATLKHLATATLPDTALTRRRLVSILRAQWALKLVMGSQHPSRKLTSRSGNQHQHARTQTSDSPQARRSAQVLTNFAQHVC